MLSKLIFAALVLLLVELIGPLALGALFWLMGKLLVTWFTLGEIECDALGTNSVNKQLRWAPLYNKRGDRYYLTAEATMGVGALSIILPVLYYLIFKD